MRAPAGARVAPCGTADYIQLGEALTKRLGIYFTSSEIIFHTLALSISTNLYKTLQLLTDNALMEPCGVQR